MLLKLWRVCYDRPSGLFDEQIRALNAYDAIQEAVKGAPALCFRRNGAGALLVTANDCDGIITKAVVYRNVMITHDVYIEQQSSDAEVANSSVPKV